MKIVPTGRLPGRVICCPTFTEPVQAPTVNEVALKLPGVRPVANCSWLNVLAKLGNFWKAVPNSTCHRFVPLWKFPDASLTGVRTAMLSVSPEPCVPNTQAVWGRDPKTGIALPALQLAN